MSTATKSAVKPTVKSTVAKTNQAATKKETLASFMRRLITAGKTNEQVFEAAVKQFKIGAEKKYYPSWYRSEMKRTAKVSTAPAKKTASKKVAAKK